MKNYGAKVSKKRTFGFSRRQKTEVGKKNKNNLRTLESKILSTLEKLST
jgi:ribosomal protein L34